MSVSDWLSKARKALNNAGWLTDSVDAIECIMAVEEIFDVTLPDDIVEKLETPHALIEWLVERVVNKPMNKRAHKLLKACDNPNLAALTSERWDRKHVQMALRELITQWTGSAQFSDDSSFKKDIFRN